MIAKRVALWGCLVVALLIGCQASAQQRRSVGEQQQTLGGLSYSFVLPAGWHSRGLWPMAASVPGGSCAQAGVFAVERDQYCVSPVGRHHGDYALVSTFPTPIDVEHLSDTDLQARFTIQYETLTSSAVEDVYTVHVAERRVITFASGGAHAWDPSGRFYLVIGSHLVVQVYCVYGNRPDKIRATLDGCEQIVHTLKIKR